MIIGACGIACEPACGLKSKGICQGCTPTLADQVPCPILKCAVSKNVQYCGRDCGDFPCQTMKKGFPYSEGYIQMLTNRMQAGR